MVNGLHPEEACHEGQRGQDLAHLHLKVGLGEDLHERAELAKWWMLLYHDQELRDVRSHCYLVLVEDTVEQADREIQTGGHDVLLVEAMMVQVKQAEVQGLHATPEGLIVLYVLRLENWDQSPTSRNTTSRYLAHQISSQLRVQKSEVRRIGSRVNVPLGHEVVHPVAKCGRVQVEGQYLNDYHHSESTYLAYLRLHVDDLLMGEPVVGREGNVLDTWANDLFHFARQQQACSAK